MNRIMLFAMLVIMTLGCAAVKNSETQSTEEMLVAAGFKMVPAENEQQMAKLNSLTPNKIEYSIRYNKPLYWYADPENCKCVYTGDADAYQRYEKMLYESNLANTEQQTAIMNEDAAMNVGLWGWMGAPWGW